MFRDNRVLDAHVGGYPVSSMGVAA